MIEINKNSKVLQDDITAALSESFDYSFDGNTSFECVVPDFPKDYQIGLIVGPSGSGKSTILNSIGDCINFNWNNDMAIASHFKDAEEAQDKLCGVGFNSVPSWFKPYSALSTGEKFRADLAITIGDNSCIDEFTSVVDRAVAKSCAFSVSRLIRKEKISRVTFATCHYDVAEWLQPDWIYDTMTSKLSLRGSHRQPERTIELYPCNTDAWPIFSKHHYLTQDINKSSRCWFATWEGQAVGFVAAIAFPSGTVKNAFRGHRTVVLPDYQGLGFGVRISDAVAEIFIQSGHRYFSKTAHPRMGGYRNNSKLWRPTSKNMKVRGDSGDKKKLKWQIRKVFSYSHEYIGAS